LWVRAFDLADGVLVPEEVLYSAAALLLEDLVDLALLIYSEGVQQVPGVSGNLYLAKMKLSMMD